jgi:hypothetical protein
VASLSRPRRPASLRQASCHLLLSWRWELRRGSEALPCRTGRNERRLAQGLADGGEVACEKVHRMKTGKDGFSPCGCEAESDLTSLAWLVVVISGGTPASNRGSDPTDLAWAGTAGPMEMADGEREIAPAFYGAAPADWARERTRGFGVGSGAMSLISRGSRRFGTSVQFQRVERPVRISILCPPFAAEG